MQSTHTSGHWLEFVSNETGEVILQYRFECGWQFPADEYVAIQQDQPPVTPVTPYIKDSSKDPVYQGNANRGGGYNTNPDGSID